MIACHFHHDLLDILISCLNCPIHLWSVDHEIQVFDVEHAAQLHHHVVVQVLGVIRHYHFRLAISADDIITNKGRDDLFSDFRECGFFYPFGEIINHDKDETMPISCFRFEGAKHIYPPHGDRP